MKQAGEARGAWAAWNRFWFQPADPVPLGLMRLVTGALVLYVHLAYCLDFTEFFGPNGWWKQEIANRERKEMPVSVGPLNWRQEAASIRLPELPHRRQAVFDFLRRLPDDPKERINRVIFLPTVYQKIAEIGERRKFFADFAALPKDRRADLKDLPGFLKNVSPSEKAGHFQEAEALLTLLPPVKDPAFGYVLDWFQDLGSPEQLRTISFIENLPRSHTEREDVLSYLEFWNADPRQVYAKGKVVFSHWFHLTDPNSMKAAHAIALVVFFLFAIGLWTRVTSVLSWLFALCYMHRSPPVLFGMDTMIAILLFYLMIGPSGAALSVDRLRARYRAARTLFQSIGQSVPWAESVLAGPNASRMANFALRLFQVHFCFIYAASGLAKVRGNTWWNNTAGWMTVVNPSFSLVHHRFFESLVLIAAEIRPLLAILCGSLVLFTLVMEIGLPLLIWTPLRPWVVIGAIFLHSGIAFLMGMSPFGLLMMTFLLAFIPAPIVRQAPAWIVRRGRPATLRFDGKNLAHRGTVSLIRAFDVAGQVTLQETRTDRVKLNEREPAESAMRELALLKPLSWVPGARLIARWLFA